MSRSTTMPRRSPRAARAGDRRGQALVEFALVALVLTGLIFGAVSFGMLLYGGQTLQQAADVGARELARLPLPATEAADHPGTLFTFDEALYGAASSASATVRAQIYDERWLVVERSSIAPGVSLSDHLAASHAPLLNRLLLPLFILDRRGTEDAGDDLYRYPGALVENTVTSNLTVLVPVVTGRDPLLGVESIEWHRVVEEVRPDPSNAASGPFSLGSTNPVDRGLVALRINYPYQAAALIGAQDAGDPASPNLSRFIEARDADVAESDPQGLLGTYQLVVPADAAAVPHNGAHAGRYGLGYHLSPLPLTRGQAAGRVRPFRKLISAQALARREVFE